MVINECDWMKIPEGFKKQFNNHIRDNGLIYLSLQHKPSAMGEKKITQTTHHVLSSCKIALSHGRKEEVHVYKREKHLNLTKELRDAGYKAVVMAVEIGARGFRNLVASLISFQSSPPHPDPTHPPPSSTSRALRHTLYNLLLKGTVPTSVRLWNHLPEKIKASGSLDSFKSKVGNINIIPVKAIDQTQNQSPETAKENHQSAYCCTTKATSD
ncbi:hypothetical protein EGW08_011699 [Elysia chlorotica]|uniref:Uncharacterized protein n=1 Tax=Elysia chlorotica TaxID=188477 RepID=A0A433TGA3_ELYCH|nr:hypothetical protein EGW08_011699 [Elysia chlorotica]